MGAHFILVRKNALMEAYFDFGVEKCAEYFTEGNSNTHFSLRFGIN